MNKPELLAPAGNLEKLKTAVNFGADAVYLGGGKLNLRANADNFTSGQLEEGIAYVHARHKKVYVTVNVFPHNQDLTGLEDYLKELRDMEADAILVSDPGILAAAKEAAPGLDIHLSTQANCTNYKSACFWHGAGVKRIVMAREISLGDYRVIREKLPESCEIEAFVHGAMCISYSGRCLLSSYMTGRDANRGECAQPCRYSYSLIEAKRPGEYYDITEDGRGTYIMNSRDLCMIEYIPQLIDAGISAFKIEGRMKSAFYVASAVKAYRAAIDRYMADPSGYTFDSAWLSYLTKPSHRPFTTGFYFDEEVKQYYDSSSYICRYDIAGVVKKYDKESGIALIAQRNKVYKGDTVEVLTQKGADRIIKLDDMRNEKGEPIDSAPSAQMLFTVRCTEELKPDDMLIKARNTDPDD